MAKKESTKEEAAIKFALKIAKLTKGCAPSVGFMMELIDDARKVVEMNDDEQLSFDYSEKEFNDL